MPPSKGSPEELLNKLRKLPENKICPNCGEESKFGFGDVCVKENVNTFICHNCKSSHQAYSHRCKSVTMSNWAMEEVEKLMEENAGGNKHCRETWLAKADSQTAVPRPKPGDKITVYKEFIQAAYDRKSFKGEGGVGSSSFSSSSLKQSSSKKDLLIGTEQDRTAVPGSQRPSRSPSGKKERVQRSPSSKAESSGTADLLSFDAFESSASAFPQQASSLDLFAAPSPSSVPSSLAVSPASTASSSAFDAFGPFSSATPTNGFQQPLQQPLGAFSSPPPPQQVVAFPPPAPTSSFDPFAPSQPAFAAAGPSGLSVMNGGMNRAAPFSPAPFDAMASFTAQPIGISGQGQSASSMGTNGTRAVMQPYQHFSGMNGHNNGFTMGNGFHQAQQPMMPPPPQRMQLSSMGASQPVTYSNSKSGDPFASLGVFN